MQKVEELAAESAAQGYITLVQGIIEEKPFWAYLAVHPDKVDEFLTLSNKEGDYHLPDFGEILEYQIGEEEPSTETRHKIEAIYQVQHDELGQVQQQAS